MHSGPPLPYSIAVTGRTSAPSSSSVAPASSSVSDSDTTSSAVQCERNLVAHAVAHDTQQIGQREVVDFGRTLERHVEVRVTVDDRLRDRGNLAAYRLLRAGLHRLLFGKRAVGCEHRQVVILARRHRAARRHALIVLDVDHGIHLHQARVVLHGHEVRGLASHVQQQRERCLIA